MAAKLKIKKGDLVQILTGKDRGKQGRVLEARPDERPRDRREPEHRQAAHDAAADRGLEPHGRRRRCSRAA